MQSNVTLKTSGDGFWSDKITNVYITNFELTCFHYHQIFSRNAVPDEMILTNQVFQVPPTFHSHPLI